MDGVSGADQLRQRRFHLFVRIHLVGRVPGVAEVLGQHGFEVLGIDVREQILGDGVGHFDGGRVFLHVGIVGDPRLPVADRLLKMMHVIGKSILKNDGRIKPAGADAFDGFLRVVQRCVGDVLRISDIRDDLFRVVDMGAVFQFDPAVSGRQSDRQIAGIDIRIPVPVDVDPGIERRQRT